MDVCARVQKRNLISALQNIWKEKYIVSTIKIRKSYYVIGIVFEKYLFSSVNWR